MREEPGLQPQFTELLPSDKTRSLTGFSDDTWAPIESWVSWSKQSLLAGSLDTGQVEATEIESDAVARDIRRLHLERAVEWKDFGVLFRSTNRLELFLEAFRRHRVPFVVTRDKQYYRRREVIEAAALVRLIVNPTDQVAMLTFLRSPLVGVPDAALIHLWRHQFPHHIVELNGSDSEPLARVESAVRGAVADMPLDIPGLEKIAGWDENLLTALSTLALLRESIRQEPPDRFVERLRRTTLLEAGEAARFLGQYRVANLERFFRRLQLSLEDSDGDVQAVLRGLKRSVTEAHEAEEALPKDAAEDAVQVMTIHKAKGLEFPHVYLVQLDAETRKGETDQTDADRRWSDGPQEYSLFGTPTLEFDRVRELRERVVAAEQVRILYVAMTRARDRLVLSGNWNDAPWKPLGLSTPTFLTLLQQREELPQSLAEVARTALEGPGFVDNGGLRWKFPGLEELEPELPTESRQVSLPTKEEVRTTSHRLRALDQDARLRMARPLLGRASLAETERCDQSPPPVPGAVTANVRDAALLVGVAVHEALERWDLTAEREEETHRQQQRAANRLSSSLTGPALTAALERTDAIFKALRSSRLIERLIEQRDRIVARELPVLLPAPDSEIGPIAGISGIVDLVLRVPESDNFLVVDYKTDDIHDESELAARAAHYRPQLDVYANALQQAFSLPARPGTEIWFVGSDAVWRSS
jgi:ATP-dependent helicase/nuclease subunit A